MHMVSRKDLNSAELETVWRSANKRRRDSVCSPPLVPSSPPMVSPLVVGGREPGTLVRAAGSEELTSPGAPIVGSWARGVSSGSGRGPQKFTNVSDVKASDGERTWINRVTSEIVFQPLHPDACALVHEERVMTVLKEPNLHFELHWRDITDGMRSPCNFLFS